MVYLNKIERKLVRFALLFKIEDLREKLSRVQRLDDDPENKKWEYDMEDERLEYESVLLKMYQCEFVSS